MVTKPGPRVAICVYLKRTARFSSAVRFRMTSSTSHLTRSRKRHAAALLLSVLGACASTLGHAEVIVSGTVASIRIVASREPISGVLSAVAESFKVPYRSVVTLDDRISGTYSGSLRDVVSRLLSGYNYVIKQKDGMVEIVVLGRRGASPAAAQTPGAQGNTFADQWRKVR